VLKQDRDPERGWPPGMEGTGRLRVDADNFDISESGAGSTETAGASKGGGGKSGGLSTGAEAILDLEPVG
jgi:hypothetical protein